MNSLNYNIKTISAIWWLIQGILLLTNEIRFFLEYKYMTFSLLVISISLMLISLLLWIVKKIKLLYF